MRDLREKCAALLAEFDARHPEIVFALRMKERRMTATEWADFMMAHAKEEPNE